MNRSIRLEEAGMKEAVYHVHVRGSLVLLVQLLAAWRAGLRFSSDNRHV